MKRWTIILGSMFTTSVFAEVLAFARQTYVPSVAANTLRVVHWAIPVVLMAAGFCHSE